MILVEELQPAPDPAECCSRFLDLPYLAFLDGQGGPPEQARYSYLAADPWRVVRGQTRETLVLDRLNDRQETRLDDPLAVLTTELAPFSSDAWPGLPPFQGGALGYIAYDWATDLPGSIVHYYDDVGLPELLMGLYDWVLAWDHQAGRAWLLSTGHPFEGSERTNHAAQRMRQVLDRLRGPRAPERPAVHPRERPRALSFPIDEIDESGPLRFRSTFTRFTYGRAVQRAREYIRAGDCFQVNLSQRFECPLREPPFALYERLRRESPAPHGAFLAGDGWAVLSVSPERFLRYDPASGQVETRPIKGTRPRGATPAEDDALAAELVASEKDMAEHLMIVDLLRNDLSITCRPGSVRVPTLLALERHPTVHHLVSTITGTLGPGHDAASLLRAAFPGGSITGAPKGRVRQIIEELEPTRRGVYCGAIGWLSFAGALDTSLAIRTGVAVGGEMLVHAGGGITADSEPDAEYDETLAKARAFFRALQAGADALAREGVP